MKKEKKRKEKKKGRRRKKLTKKKWEVMGKNWHNNIEKYVKKVKNKWKVENPIEILFSNSIFSFSVQN